MKTKIISLFLSVVFLCSCSGDLVRFEPKKYADSVFIMDTGGYEIRGRVNVASYEDVTLTFTYPEGLSYLTLKVTSDGYFADVGGVSDETSSDALPDDAPVKLFAESLKAFMFEQNDFTKDENGDYRAVRDILGETVEASFSEDGSLREIISGRVTVSLTGRDEG